jgi:MoxR-like ATPase
MPRPEWIAERDANPLAACARRHGRDYVTPEDVREVLQGGLTHADVRYSLCQLVGRKFAGVEDLSLAMFVASERE